MQYDWRYLLIYINWEKMLRKKKLNVLFKSVLLCKKKKKAITHWEYILENCVSSKFPTAEVEILEFPNV